MGRRLQRSRDERGAVLVLMSIALVVLIGATALAVDIGQETVKNRRLQQVADAVAFDAARALNGQTVSQLSAANGAVTLAVSDSAARNNFPSGSLTAELGTMSGSTFTAGAASSVPTAVRITATGTTQFAFARVIGGSSVATGRKAVATRQSIGGFSIGSWLASLSGGNNTVLGALFGDAFHLNVVSYNGLVGGTVTLRQLGLNMPVSVLSPTQLLNTSVSMHDLMLAAISALNAQGNTAAANVLNSMMLNASVTGTVKMGDFINVAAGGETAAADASLNVLQLLTASAMVMEKNSGHALSIPTASVSIPGIASVTASATVIDGPKFYVGTAPGPTPPASTAQVRLTITPVINTTTGTQNTPCTLSLSSLLGLVGCVLNPLLPVGVTLNGSFPVDVTAASATGQLTAVNCATPGITVGYTTQAVNLNAAANLNLDVTLLNQPFLNAARISVASGGKTSPTSNSVSFNYPGEFVPAPAKSVGSSNLGLNGLLNVTSANVSVLNGTLNTPAVSSIVASLAVPVLNSLLGSLDSALVLPIMQSLGAKFGGADIAAISYTCNGLRLVG
jgi:uncharacterized membrane protein